MQTEIEAENTTMFKGAMHSIVFDWLVDYVAKNTRGVANVAVVGPVGAGKTTLLDRSESVKSDYVYVIDELSDFTTALLVNKTAWGIGEAFVQASFPMASALRGMRAAISLGGDGVLLWDRALQEHSFFAEFYARGDALSSGEREALKYLNMDVSDNISYDLIVWMDASPAELRRRVLSRGREYEKEIWTEENLSVLAGMYSVDVLAGWLSTDGVILRIDTEKDYDIPQVVYGDIDVDMALDV